MKSKSPWLRLVYDRTRSVRDEGSPLRLQYHLPLSIPHNVILADVSEFKFSDLDFVVSFAKPSWILDFRRNARFDSIAGGRVHAFRIFDRYETEYVDVMGMIPAGLPFLEMKRQSLWNRTFKYIFMRREVKGPFLILCDDRNRFLDLSQPIIRGLSHATKARLSLSLLDVRLARRGSEPLREVM